MAKRITDELINIRQTKKIKISDQNSALAHYYRGDLLNLSKCILENPNDETEEVINILLNDINNSNDIINVNYMTIVINHWKKNNVDNDTIISNCFDIIRKQNNDRAVFELATRIENEEEQLKYYLILTNNGTVKYPKQTYIWLVNYYDSKDEIIRLNHYVFYAVSYFIGKNDWDSAMYCAQKLLQHNNSRYVEMIITELGNSYLLGDENYINIVIDFCKHHIDVMSPDSLVRVCNSAICNFIDKHHNARVRYHGASVLHTNMISVFGKLFRACYSLNNVFRDSLILFLKKFFEYRQPIDKIELIKLLGLTNIDDFAEGSTLRILKRSIELGLHNNNEEQYFTYIAS